MVLLATSCRTQVAPAGTAVPSGSAAASTITVASGACPTPAPGLLAMITSRSITDGDSGKTLTVHQTDRFSLYLDDRMYPLEALQTDPADRLGVVSNGAIRGPSCFPIMFEAVSEGRAVIRDGNFELAVLVDNQAPVSQIPLH